MEPSQPQSTDARARGWLLRTAQRIAPAENPSGVVYGIIVIGALLAAESARHETYLDTVASTLIAAALYWFAHSYANVLGARLERQERLGTRALARELAHNWAIMRGAALPLLALVLAWIAGATLSTAVTAALWSAIASLVAFELFAGIRSRASTSELALDAGAGAAMGIAILTLKIILH